MLVGLHVGSESLLSLYPRLIKQPAGRCGQGLWVWLGGTQALIAGPVLRCRRARTLLGPEKTPAGAGFSWFRPSDSPSTAPGVGVRVDGFGGVVVC